MGNTHFEELKRQYNHLDGATLLDIFLNKEMPGEIALVSSFGTEAAILLHMVSKINKNTAVIFLETGHHFPETLTYRDALITRLGLKNVQNIVPDTKDLKEYDPENNLWQTDTNQCCQIRKVSPLAQAIQPYQGWITGRKRAHGGLRKNLEAIEVSDSRLKINPLLHWQEQDIQDYYKQHNLPPHPLVAEGYTSIGCAPCTSKACASGGRSGRWAGQEKTECGIHFENGKLVRTTKT